MAFDRTRVREALEAALNRPSVSHSEFLDELQRDFQRLAPRPDPRIKDLVEAAKRTPEFINRAQAKRA